MHVCVHACACVCVCMCGVHMSALVSGCAFENCMSTYVLTCMYVFSVHEGNGTRFIVFYTPSLSKLSYVLSENSI